MSAVSSHTSFRLDRTDLTFLLVIFVSQVMTAGAVVPFLLPSSLPDNDETRLKFSAAHLATATYPPTYFVVPQMDTLVPPTQSWMFEKRLKELGVEVHSVRVDEGVHGFDRKVS